MFQDGPKLAQSSSICGRMLSPYNFEKGDERTTLMFQKPLKVQPQLMRCTFGLSNPVQEIICIARNHGSRQNLMGQERQHQKNGMPQENNPT